MNEGALVSEDTFGQRKKIESRLSFAAKKNDPESLIYDRKSTMEYRSKGLYNPLAM